MRFMLAALAFLGICSSELAAQPIDTGEARELLNRQFWQASDLASAQQVAESLEQSLGFAVEHGQVYPRVYLASLLNRLGRHDEAMWHAGFVTSNESAPPHARVLAAEVAANAHFRLDPFSRDRWRGYDEAYDLTMHLVEQASTGEFDHTMLPELVPPMHASQTEAVVYQIAMQERNLLRSRWNAAAQMYMEVRDGFSAPPPGLAEHYPEPIAGMEPMEAWWRRAEVDVVEHATEYVPAYRDAWDGLLLPETVNAFEQQRVISAFRHAEMAAQFSRSVYQEGGNDLARSIAQRTFDLSFLALPLMPTERRMAATSSSDLAELITFWDDADIILDYSFRFLEIDPPNPHLMGWINRRVGVHLRHNLNDPTAALQLFEATIEAFRKLPADEWESSWEYYEAILYAADASIRVGDLQAADIYLREVEAAMADNPDLSGMEFLQHVLDQTRPALDQALREQEERETRVLRMLETIAASSNSSIENDENAAGLKGRSDLAPQRADLSVAGVSGSADAVQSGRRSDDRGVSTVWVWGVVAAVGFCVVIYIVLLRRGQTVGV